MTGNLLSSHKPASQSLTWRNVFRSLKKLIISKLSERPNVARNLASRIQFVPTVPTEFLLIKSSLFFAKFAQQNETNFQTTYERKGVRRLN